MGFADSLGKALGQLGSFYGLGVSGSKRGPGLERGASAFSGAFSANPFSPLFTNARTSGLLPDNRDTRTIGGLLAPDTAINQTLLDQDRNALFRDKLDKFFKGEEQDVPPLSKTPGQGGKTTKAKTQARDRALQAASQRRGLGLSGTIATSPLGLMGDGATTSSRRLIGE